MSKKTQKNTNEKALAAAALSSFSTSFIAQSSMDRLAAYSKDEIASKLLEVAQEAALVKSENLTLKQKITAIIAELAQAVGMVTFPAKISIWWVLSNLKIVIDLVKAVIDILKAGRADNEVPVVVSASFKNNSIPLSSTYGSMVKRTPTESK